MYTDIIVQYQADDHLMIIRADEFWNILWYVRFGVENSHLTVVVGGDVLIGNTNGLTGKFSA